MTIRAVCLAACWSVFSLLFPARVVFGQEGFFSEGAMASESEDDPNAPAEPDSERLQLRFKFVEPSNEPTAEERERVRLLSETIRHVEYSFTPRTITGLLAVNEPAEKIRVEKLVGDKYAIWVGVNYIRHDNNRYTLICKPVSKADWESLVKVIAQHNLAEWKPWPAGSAAPINAAIREIKIGGGVTNWQTWFSPLENGDAAAALVNELVGLARKRVSYLPLAYIRPLPRQTTRPAVAPEEPPAEGAE